MEDPLGQILAQASEIKQFFSELGNFLYKNLLVSFLKFEAGKNIFVAALYRQRGRLSRRLIHTGMAGLAAVGMMIAPVIAQEFPGIGQGKKKSAVRERCATFAPFVSEGD